MTTVDPRERLVEVGNKLLDVFYETQKWEQKYPDIQRMVDQQHAGQEPSPDQISAMTERPDFAQMLISRITLSAEYSRLSAEYTLLRETIEALEAPRQTMFPGVN